VKKDIDGCLLTRDLTFVGHGLCSSLGWCSPGHASDKTADAIIRTLWTAVRRFPYRRFGGHNTPTPDAASPTVMVVMFVEIGVLWWLIMVLVMGILVVYNFVVVTVLAPLDIVPDLECVGKGVDHCDNQELAHQYRLDCHNDHLDLLLEQIDTKQNLQNEFLDFFLDLLFLVMSSAYENKRFELSILYYIFFSRLKLIKKK